MGLLENYHIKLVNINYIHNRTNLNADSKKKDKQVRQKQGDKDEK